MHATQLREGVRDGEVCRIVGVLGNDSKIVFYLSSDYDAVIGVKIVFLSLPFTVTIDNSER